MSVLFIQGWNTIDRNIYDNIFNIINMEQLQLTIFKYKNGDNLNVLFEKLNNILSINNFDYIIGHSMGM
jgi:hypothetical protein